MLEVACLIGVMPCDFWPMTPAELTYLIKAYNKRMKHEQEERITLTYLGAYWQRVKKMPKLTDVLGKQNEEKKKQTPEQMLAQIKKINAALGGNIT